MRHQHSVGGPGRGRGVRTIQAGDWCARVRVATTRGAGARRGTARASPPAPTWRTTSGFARLARVHALLVSSDALVAVALAGSLFFSIPTGEARGRVALYLLLTMAPFAIVAPIIGPALDRMRGGARWMVIATAAGRIVVCAFMVGDLDRLLLFPEAFLFLVLSKTYQVAKSALVPAVVTTDDRAGRGQLAGSS